MFNLLKEKKPFQWGLFKNRLIISCLPLLLLFSSQVCYGFDFNFTKENKVWLTNIGGVLFITGWGVSNWDYFSEKPSIQNEGWFGKNTKEGGADKLGHFHITYTLSHLMSHSFYNWGYSKKKAAFYGALSSFGLMGYMEFGDSFSEYGFSHEDLMMNGIGAVAGYLLYRYPNWSKKIDFRAEYKPDFTTADIFTDYDRIKYLAVVKLEGFDAVTNPYLKYLEIHLGFYAKGYSNPDKADRRKLYLGLGINVSRLLRKKSWKRTSKLLNYFQIPYTYVAWEKELN